MSRLGATTLAMVLVLGLGWRAEAASDADVARLAELFDSVVFGSEISAAMAAPVVRKWVAPIRYKLAGHRDPAERFRPAIARHARALARLTRLSFEEIAPDAPDESLIVWFTAASKMLEVGRVFEKDEARLRDIVRTAAAGCYFLSYFLDDGRLVYGAIVVNHERPPALTDACLLEELAQSLGLPNDDSRISPSIFNDADHLQRLSRIDALLIRTLYDPRIAIGASRAEAVEASRAVIADLLR
jgi:hypothetical protein